MKKEEIIGRDYRDIDELKYNLHLRSLREPASYFEWKNPEQADGVPILARRKNSMSDPNIKVAFDNFSLIGNTKASYLASNIQRTYSDDIDESIQDKYKEFDRLNNFMPTLRKMMASNGMWGNTYGLCYLDRRNQVRFKQVNAWQAKVDYDEETGDPYRGIIYYDKGKERFIKEYTETEIITYKASKDDKSEYIEIDRRLHGFQEVPLIEFMNNEQRAGNSQKAVPLMDAYDRLMSDNITENSALRNAYLLLKNAGNLDSKAKKEMQETGVFPIDDEKGDVKFITKDINPEFTKFVTEQTWSGIWIVGCSVDPKAVSILSNATAFQISQMYKLMEEDAQHTETEWLISLEYLDRVLKSYWTGLDIQPVGDYSTYDINYVFNRNIPKDIVSDLEAIQRAGGNLPQEVIFMLGLGISEEKAKEMVEIAAGELTNSLVGIE